MEITINKEQIIEKAKLFGLQLEYDSEEKQFLRFRHHFVPKYDTRFAIVIYTTQNLSDVIDTFQKALLDVGKYLKEQEIIKVLNLK